MKTLLTSILILGSLASYSQVKTSGSGTGLIVTKDPIRIGVITNIQSKARINLGAYGKMKVAEQTMFTKEVAKISKTIKLRDSVYQQFIIQFIAASGVDMSRVSFSNDSLRITQDSIVLKLRKPRK